MALGNRYACLISNKPGITFWSLVLKTHCWCTVMEEVLRYLQEKSLSTRTHAMESQVKCHSPQNIYGATQQNSIAEFPKTT